jgi:hypothetical protein
MHWQTLAGPRHIYSAVAGNSDGRLELFALTEGGSLEHCWQMSPGDSAHWSEWHSLGKGEWDEAGPSAFAVALDNNGCLQLLLVADGTTPYAPGQIFHNGQRSAGAHGGGADEWIGWQSLDARYAQGWSNSVGPTVVRGTDGRLNLFVMSANRGVLEEKWWSDYTNSTNIGHYQQNQDGSWTGPEIRLSIETCIEVEGRPDYICKSKLPIRLAASLNSDGRLELFANAGDLQAKRRDVSGITYIPAYLWHARQTGDHSKNWGFSDFPMPPTTAGDMKTDYDAQPARPAEPVVVPNHEGNLELYVWGQTDHHVWSRKQDPTVEGRWLPWCNVGGPKELGRPVVVSDRNHMLTVLATNMTSDTILTLSQSLDDGGRAVWPEEWQSIAAGAEGEAAPGTAILQAATNQDGRIEIFTDAPDNSGFLHMYQSSPGKWS